MSDEIGTSGIGPQVLIKALARVSVSIKAKMKKAEREASFRHAQRRNDRSLRNAAYLTRLIARPDTAIAPEL
jgi:hypothetical protein